MIIFIILKKISIYFVQHKLFAPATQLSYVFSYGYLVWLLVNYCNVCIFMYVYLWLVFYNVLPRGCVVFLYILSLHILEYTCPRLMLFMIKRPEIKLIPFYSFILCICRIRYIDGWSHMQRACIWKFNQDEKDLSIIYMHIGVEFIIPSPRFC